MISAHAYSTDQSWIHDTSDDSTTDQCTIPTVEQASGSDPGIRSNLRPAATTSLTLRLLPRANGLCAFVDISMTGACHKEMHHNVHPAIKRDYAAAIPRRNFRSSSSPFSLLIHRGE